VHGLEALEALIKAPPADYKTTAGRVTFFKACVTVLFRLLQDKIVPVFLPALQVLRYAYSPTVLCSVPKELALEGIELVATQLITRAGSSNIRAREESCATIQHLARTQLGAHAVCKHALQPLPNRKSQTAAVGRIELLRALLSEFGLGDCWGLSADQTLAFVLPLCELASDKVRSLAILAVGDVYRVEPSLTCAFITQQQPHLTHILAKLEPAHKEAQAKSPRRLPPLRNSGQSADPHHPSHESSASPVWIATADGGKKKTRTSSPDRQMHSTQRRRTDSQLGAETPPPTHSLFDEMDEEIMEAILSVEPMP